jgi:hypothetical protein
VHYAYRVEGKDVKSIKKGLKSAPDGHVHRSVAGFGRK